MATGAGSRRSRRRREAASSASIVVQARPIRLQMKKNLSGLFLSYVVVVVVGVVKDWKRGGAGSEERNPRARPCCRRPECASPLLSDEFLAGLVVEAQVSEEKLARVKVQDREEELAPVLALAPERGVLNRGDHGPLLLSCCCCSGR